MYLCSSISRLCPVPPVPSGIFCWQSSRDNVSSCLLLLILLLLLLLHMPFTAVAILYVIIILSANNDRHHLDRCNRCGLPLINKLNIILHRHHCIVVAEQTTGIVSLGTGTGFSLVHYSQSLVIARNSDRSSPSLKLSRL